MTRNHYIIVLLTFCMVWLFPLSIYASNAELNEGEKAELFNQVMSNPVWVEETITLRNDRTLEQAKKIAITGAKFQARRIFRDRIVQTEGLELRKEMIDFSGFVKVIGEDTTGDYGQPYEIEENGTNVWKVTFRFETKCDKIGEINPFVQKQHYDKPSIIKDFKETDEYWEIVAVGYGYYESFDDIDSKRRISSEKAVDSACNAIINKVKELGINDQETQEKIIREVKAKKNYGGVYRVLGCGVELDAYVPIRISKGDASVSFIYK